MMLDSFSICSKLKKKKKSRISPSIPTGVDDLLGKRNSLGQSKEVW